MYLILVCVCTHCIAPSCIVSGYIINVVYNIFACYTNMFSRKSFPKREKRQHGGLELEETKIKSYKLSHK